MDANSAGAFPVRFSQGWLAVPSNSAGLYGRGELQLGVDSVELRGLARRGFHRGRVRTLRVPLADIIDVECQGTRVRFEVLTTHGPAQYFTFWTSDATAAAEIVARLPAAQSAAFRKALAESREFRARLMAVSPTANVTPVLIGANVLVFLAMALAGAGVWVPDPAVHLRWGSNFGPRTLEGEWWRLGTSMFLHYGAIHLLLNMWVLHAYGTVAERLYGSAHFLTLYLFAGLSGSLTSVWWHPQVNSAGASGAIFGTFGGLLAFLVHRKNGVPPSIMISHRNSMLLFLGYNLIIGFSHPGIDNAAHVGGLVAGFLLGLALARPLDAQRRAQEGALRLMTAAAACAALLVFAAQSIA